jgi:tRNA U34 2-thiouridine synthase MnmA/TrmU
MVPLTDAYWDRVVTDTIADIRRGHTPNPDVLCNSRQGPGTQAARPALEAEL